MITIKKKKHPENIFIHSDNIKLGDFGLSKSIICSTISSLKTQGSTRHSDPEYLNDINNYKRTKASDVYSVGVLMWEISSGKLPFQDISVRDFIIGIIKGDREKTIPGTPESYNNIYRGI